jgi:hypothetical protein
MSHRVDALTGCSALALRHRQAAVARREATAGGQPRFHEQAITSRRDRQRATAAAIACQVSRRCEEIQRPWQPATVAAPEAAAKIASGIQNLYETTVDLWKKSLFINTKFTNLNTIFILTLYIEIIEAS